MKRISINVFLLCQLIIINILFFGLSANARAQKDEDYWSIGVSGNLTSGTAKVEAAAVSIDGFGRGSTSLSIYLDKAININEKYKFIAGGKYDLYNSEDLKVNNFGLIKRRASMSWYAAPARVISDETLAYLKFSYESANLERIPNVDDSSVAVETKKISGTGLSVGMRSMLSKNIHMQLEIGRAKYKTMKFDSGMFDLKPSMTIGSIAIGYRF